MLGEAVFCSLTGLPIITLSIDSACVLIDSGVFGCSEIGIASKFVSGSCFIGGI